MRRSFDKIEENYHFSCQQGPKDFFLSCYSCFFLGCVVSWLSLTYFVIGEYLLDSDFDQLRKVIPVLLGVASILMFVVIFWTLRISNRHFGSYDRIIDDLDNVLSGTKKWPLETRKGDVIFEKLVKRINVLIEKTQ